MSFSAGTVWHNVKKRPQVVIVEWEDANLDTGYDGARKGAGGTIILHDVGFLLANTRKNVTLAMCYCDPNDTVRHILTIPKSLVRRIIPFQEKT